MQKVLTAEQMRTVDRLTTERYGIPSIVLMENAAHAVARVITEKLGGSVAGKSVLILCGKGNNGGDGAALARILSAEGARQEVYLFGKIEETKGDAKTNFEELRKIASLDINDKGALYLEESTLIDYWVHTTGFETGTFDVIVDALFGTGLSRPLDVLYRNVPLTCSAPHINDEVLVVSIDLPSGLNSDLSEAPEIHMDPAVTVTFTSPKPANVLAPAWSVNGELVVADIGSPQELIEEQPSQLYLSTAEDARKWLEATDFSADSYKNKRGHALLIAGSADYTGAAVLCGNAAIRSGAGLVTLAVPASCKSEIASRVLPEVILTGIGENETGGISENAFGESKQQLAAADAIAVGCGLSANDPGVEQLVRQIVTARQTPVIIDAGALWFFSPHAGCVGRAPIGEGSDERSPLILTPHEGEFLRLLGTEDKNAITDRVAAVRDFASTNNVILVLKGERVLIAEPGGRVVVNPTGNAGLGKAGNGDTLTGIVAGFVAQAARLDLDIFETVVAAVYVAGMAGDIAEQKYGKRVMTASDVRECLVEVFELLVRP